MKVYLQKYSFILFLTIIYLSCSSSSVYDKTTVDLAVSLKTLSLYLMGNAINSYNDFKPQIEDLEEKLNNAYKYEQNRVNNNVITKKWEELISPNEDLLGGFLAKWKSQNKLSVTFITQAKNKVRNGFDEIIDYEKSKR